MSWQSICNGVGQTAGFFIGNMALVVFESAPFCNKYIRPSLGLPEQEFGMITIKSDSHLIKLFFAYNLLHNPSIIKTSCFFWRGVSDDIDSCNFKKEKSPENEPKISLIESYKIIFRLFSMKPIQKVAIILLTVKV